MDRIQNDERQLEQKVREVAFVLREKIRKSKTRPLPMNSKVEDVLQGEIATPELLVLLSPYHGTKARPRGK